MLMAKFFVICRPFPCLSQANTVFDIGWVDDAVDQKGGELDGAENLNVGLLDGNAGSGMNSGRGRAQ
jgi:hypothetical protein